MLWVRRGMGAATEGGGRDERSQNEDVSLPHAGRTCSKEGDGVCGYKAYGSMGVPAAEMRCIGARVWGWRWG